MLSYLWILSGVTILLGFYRIYFYFFNNTIRARALDLQSSRSNGFSVENAYRVSNALDRRFRLKFLLPFFVIALLTKNIFVILFGNKNTFAEYFALFYCTRNVNVLLFEMSIGPGWRGSGRVRSNKSTAVDSAAVRARNRRAAAGRPFFF